MTAVIWIHQARPRTSWYSASEEEKSALLQRWSASDAEALAAGSDRIGTYSVRGQSDYSTVELWRFASPELAFDFWERRVRDDYAVWFAFSNQLGVAIESGEDDG